MGKSYRESRNWHEEDDADEEQKRDFRRSQKRRYLDEGQRLEREDDRKK